MLSNSKDSLKLCCNVSVRFIDLFSTFVSDIRFPIFNIELNNEIINFEFQLGGKILPFVAFDVLLEVPEKDNS